jgi:hypothetical protein
MNHWVIVLLELGLAVLDHPQANQCQWPSAVLLFPQRRRSDRDKDNNLIIIVGVFILHCDSTAIKMLLLT